MKILDRVKQLATTIRLRRGIISDPTRTADNPPPLVQQKAQRSYSPAKQAAPWTDDVTRRNAEIARTYDEELARRTALMENGEYTPRFGSPEADMSFEMRTANVTAQAPQMPILSPVEFEQGRKLGTLNREVQYEERKRLDPTIQIPPRPTRKEILEAAGGDEDRADQLEARVDELFGPERSHWCYVDGRGPRERRPGSESECKICGARAAEWQGFNA